MIDTLLFIIIGVLVGLLTGLLPAFHPNNVIAIILLNLPFFLEIFGLYNLIAFIVALSISHNCEASPFRAGSKFLFLFLQYIFCDVKQEQRVDWPGPMTPTEADDPVVRRVRWWFPYGEPSPFRAGRGSVLHILYFFSNFWYS